MTTVDRIFQIMTENNLTAKEFAKLTGLSPGNITDWKTGRSKPSIVSLLKISETFNTNIEWLLGNADKKDDLEFPYLEIPYTITENYFNNLPPRIVYIIKRIASSLLIENPPDKQLRSYIIQDLEDFSFPTYYKSIIQNAIVELYFYNKKHNTRFPFNHINNTKSNVFPTPTDNKLYMCPVYGRIAAGVPNWAEQCMEGRLPLDPDMMNIHNPEECFFLRVSGESMNKVVKNGGYALIRKQEDVENGDIAVVLVNGYDATLKKFTRKNDMVVLEPMSDDSSFEIQIYDRTTQIKILGKYIGKFEMN